MSPERTVEHDLDCAMRELRLAPALTNGLLTHVIDLSCTRIPLLARAGKTARMHHLIGAGAHVEKQGILQGKRPKYRIQD